MVFGLFDMRGHLVPSAASRSWYRRCSKIPEEQGPWGLDGGCTWEGASVPFEHIALVPSDPLSGRDIEVQGTEAAGTIGCHEQDASIG
jgi:hypothetical protein